MTWIHEIEFESVNLAEKRMVTVFLPPGHRQQGTYPLLFCADGQAVHSLSERLYHAIEHECVPPVILVGVHSSNQHRAQEYIFRAGSDRFEAHARFFTDEIYRWAIAEFNPSIGRRSTGVFGVSNGGAFALSIGMRHREEYGVVIAFSIAGGPVRFEESECTRRPIARFYLSAGTRETPFRKTGRAVAKLFAKHGVEHAITERCAGHEFSFWNAELPEAIRWAFSDIASTTYDF